MKPLALLPLGLLALGLAWGASPAEGQTFSINLGELLSGRGPAIGPATGYPYGDPYQADRPAYPYGPQRYGQPFDPRGYDRPALPGEPPYGIYPPQAGYGPPTYRDAYRPPFPGGPPGFAPQQLAGLADTLVGQANDFLQVFTPTAGVVPEGQHFLADARMLAEAAGRFRQAVVGGVPPFQLSQELAGVEGSWGQLQQRTQRVARGRSGPNIQQIGLMGNTLQQMRAMLP